MGHVWAKILLTCYFCTSKANFNENIWERVPWIAELKELSVWILMTVMSQNFAVYKWLYRISDSWKLLKHWKVGRLSGTSSPNLQGVLSSSHTLTMQDQASAAEEEVAISAKSGTATPWLPISCACQLWRRGSLSNKANMKMRRQPKTYVLMNFILNWI